MKTHLLIGLILNLTTTVFSQSVQNITESLRESSSFEEAAQRLDGSCHCSLNNFTYSALYATDSAAIAAKLRHNELPFAVNDQLLTAPVVVEDSSGFRYYKAFSKSKIELYRVQYIQFDIKTISKIDIERNRDHIIERFRKETPLQELTAGINDAKFLDSGWFGQKVMVEEIETAVKTMKVGEMRRVDSRENGWYFVIYKSHETKLEPVYDMIEVAVTSDQ